jgi:hypothetical protein
MRTAIPPEEPGTLTKYFRFVEASDPIREGPR